MTPFNINPAQTLVFKDKISVQKFSSKFNKTYSLEWLKSENIAVSYLDSFDGRLFCAGYTLTLAKNKVYIKSEKEKDKILTEDWPANKLPVKAKDFSNPVIRKLIDKLLAVRSLYKILSLDIIQTPFSVLNTDRKIISRGYFLQCNNKYPQIAKSKSKSILFLKPLRGYATCIKEIIKTLPVNKIYSDFSRAILTEFSIDLKDYSKPLYDLKGKTKISQALFEILYKNFLIIKKNEKGIVADIDIEFLHDYRVACRRMRSALALIRNVLDPLHLQMLKTDLKYLGHFSGPLRDLDVYLLREAEYKALLPAQWPQKDIHAIFIKLKSQRRTAFKRMVKILKVKEYKELVKRWQDFFENFESYIISDTPLLKTASALILKWFSRIIKYGRILTVKDPDEKFHSLRIKCKKLRYLLEFFGPLYPEASIDKAVKQLKKLQENLGEFNDYSVQIETLNLMLRRSVKQPLNFVKTVAGLITVLDYKMHQLKNEFYTLFEEFSSQENIRLYNNIFGKIK